MFNSSLIEIFLGTEFLCVVTFRYYFNQLEDFEWPRTLWKLTFGKNFNQLMIRHVISPDNMRDFTFGKCFDREIKGVAWLPVVWKLSFSRDFNRSLDKTVSPNLLEKLVLGAKFEMSRRCHLGPGGRNSSTKTISAIISNGH